MPDGTYRIKLRAEGGFHGRYFKRYGADWHKGMICIHNRPDWKLEADGMEFQYILIHVGNDDDDTAGCLLPGTNVLKKQSGDYTLQYSTMAYRLTYPILRDAILKNIF